MGKKVNGLLIDFEKRQRNFLVKNRRGETVESKPSLESAMEAAKKNRDFVKYSPSLGTGTNVSQKKKNKKKKS